MFIIRDKESGEVWFAGTVYEPLSLEEEPMFEEYNNYSLDGFYKYSDYLRSPRTRA